MKTYPKLRRNCQVDLKAIRMLRIGVGCVERTIGSKFHPMDWIGQNQREREKKKRESKSVIT